VIPLSTEHNLSASCATRFTANEFVDFFDKKANDIRTVTRAEFADASNIAQLLCFIPVSIDDEIKQVVDAPNKYSSMDSSPTWLLKSFIKVTVTYWLCI
jgi:hypothetical protein